MMEIEIMKEQIKSGVTSDRDTTELDNAFELAQLAHANQTRDEGTPYIFHPMRVALILTDEFHVRDIHTVVLAILHDVPEKIGGRPSTDLLSDIGSLFGDHTAEELRTLTTKIGVTREERDSYYIRAIRESPMHVKLVKLADRIDNVRSLRMSPSVEKRKRYIHETERDFMPFARDVNATAYAALKHALDDAKRIA